MNLFDLKNNALFIRHWRERMRLPYLVSSIVLSILVIGILIINTYFDAKKDIPTLYNVKNWTDSFVLSICIFQGMILLFFGTISSGRMASLERCGGTLDFHRSSPSNRDIQAIGIILGSASLEWCIFLSMSFFTGCFLTFSSSVHLLTYLKFNISIVVCALLFHSFAVFIGFVNNSKKMKQGSDQVMVLIFLILLFQLAVVALNTFVYQLTFFPTYETLFLAMNQNDPVTLHSLFTYKVSDPNNIRYMLYGFNLPILYYQLVIQITFIFVLLGCIKKSISFPERPSISKGPLLTLILLILFLIAGNDVTVFLNGTVQFFPKFTLGFFVYAATIIGLQGAFISTPTKLLYLKGLRKCKKLNKKNLPSLDDLSSNTVWTLGYSVITSLVFVIYAFFLKMTFLNALTCILITLSYTIFYANIYEFFNLSKMHQKKIIFVTALIILWILVPILISIFEPINNAPSIHTAFFAVSPFTGLTSIIKAEDKLSLPGIASPKLVITLFVSWFMTIFSIILSSIQRRHLKMMIVQND